MNGALEAVPGEEPNQENPVVRGEVLLDAPLFAAV